LNRRQDTDDVMLADADSGAATVVTSEHDAAWVDVVNELEWLHDGKDLLWISERDGWRHVYTISRDGKQIHLATPGAFDVESVVRVESTKDSSKDSKNVNEEWLYYIASPDNATQRYLYRSRLVGTRITFRRTFIGRCTSIRQLTRRRSSNSFAFPICISSERSKITLRCERN
jgi:dipeptidyl-peptidase-4